MKGQNSLISFPQMLPCELIVQKFLQPKIKRIDKLLKTKAIEVARTSHWRIGIPSKMMLRERLSLKRSSWSYDMTV
jgi:hypothetical protein